MKNKPTDEEKKKESRNMDIFLLILPIGIGGLAWIWSRWGFVYALLFSVFYFPLGLIMVFSKK